MEKLNFAIHFDSALILFVIAIPFMIAGCFGGQKISGPNHSDNIDIVKKYFKAIDNRDSGAMSELFATDAIQNFVGNDPIVGVTEIEKKLELILSQITSMQTEFISFIAEGDIVFAHVKHVAVFKAGGAFKNRSGIRPPVVVLATPERISWQAMATFKFKDSRIVEERIVRDELAILQGLGTITLK